MSTESPLEYWIAAKGQKNKRIHAIGKCNSIMDARRAANIWVNLIKQSNPILHAEIVDKHTYYYVEIIDSNGYPYPMIDPERRWLGWHMGWV